MNLFQTSLYIYSSLLQADAAILGFGAIFIIYKIQSLENVRQNIIQTYHAQGRIGTNTVNTLILGKPEQIADLLVKQHDVQRFDNYKYIVCIPAKCREIGGSIRTPVIVIVIHAILCGVLLYLSQFIYQYVVLQNWLLISAVLLFAVGIYLAARLAIGLLTGMDQFQISGLRPDIFQFVVDKKEVRWHSGQSESAA